MRAALLSSLLVLTLGCAGPVAPPALKSVAEFPAERVNYERTWRDAHRITPENGVAGVDLGMVPEGSVLRLGVLPPVSGAPVGCRVLGGNEVLWDARTPARHRWHDRRVALRSGGKCRIRFQCEEPFWIAPCEVVVPGSDARPNVLIFVIDALRQDHLGLYGYARNTSPNIDAFAKDAAVFTQMTPQSSWTRPSVASLLTGVYPAAHGAQDADDIMRGGLPSLARALAGQGYETHLLMSNDNCLPQWGFGGDFFAYDYVPPSQDDGVIVDHAIEVLRHTSGRPWFFYVHVMGPHGPYWPPEPEYFTRFQPRTPDEVKAILEQSPNTEPFDQIRRVLGLYKENPQVPVPQEGAPVSLEALRRLCADLYDGDIAFTDAQFARLLGALKELGLYDNTLIILTADHGEEFWEHGGYRHGQTLYEDQLRVPFVVRMLGGAAVGVRRTGLINMVDLAPTLLEGLGAPAESGFQGKSFLSLLLEGKGDGRLGFASLFRVKYEANLRVAKTPEQKCLQDLFHERETWYDLVGDPGEQQPLASPPEDAERFQTHARTCGVRGASGLYLLITCDLETEQRITGTLTAPGLDNVELRYPPELAHWSLEAGTLEFEVVMKTRPELTEFQQDYQALFHASAAPEGELRLRVQRDGRDAAATEVFLGKEKRPGDLAGAAIPIRDLAAGADTVNLAGLPRQFAVYLWDVPDVERLTEKELDPEMRGNLEALGYLD